VANESPKVEIQPANEELATLDIENRRRLEELGRLSGICAICSSPRGSRRCWSIES
jgi:hypothetical protein